MDLETGIQATVTALAAIPGVDTASTDSADIVAPGVLVRAVGIPGTGTLDGRDVDLELVLVVADVDGGPGPLAALSGLLAAVETYATADGPIVFRRVQLPSNPAPLPGLVFPLTVRIPA